MSSREGRCSKESYCSSFQRGNEMTFSKRLPNMIPWKKIVATLTSVIRLRGEGKRNVNVGID
jgi:hypothetical protein